MGLLERDEGPMIARIQIGDVVLKPVGRGWGVGRIRGRIIQGRETEQLIEPAYFSSAAIAMPYFLGRASSGPRSSRNVEAELLRVLAGEEGERPGASPLYVLAAPDAAARAARDGETLAAFSRACGVSRRALRTLEAGGSTPYTDTLLRVLLAGLRP